MILLQPYTVFFLFSILYCDISDCQIFCPGGYIHLDITSLDINQIMHIDLSDEEEGETEEEYETEEGEEGAEQDDLWPETQQQMLMELQAIQLQQGTLNEAIGSCELTAEESAIYQNISQRLQQSLAEFYEEISQYSPDPEDDIDSIWERIRLISAIMIAALKKLQQWQE